MTELDRYLESQTIQRYNDQRLALKKTYHKKKNDIIYALLIVAQGIFMGLVIGFFLGVNWDRF